MATDFYAGKAATASRLLAKRGMAMTLRRTAPSSSDPVAGTVTKGAAVDYAVNGVVSKFSTQLIAAGLIGLQDKLVLIEAGVVEPTKDDVLVISGKPFVILNVDEVNPAGTPVLYQLQVRA